MTGDSTWQSASEVVDIDVPLPATATDEVVVVLGHTYGCLGMIPWLPTASMLVDDLRVE